jgi:RNA polymerase sigma-70 factor (ECF subfamily)
MVIERKYGEVERAEELLPLAFQILRFKVTAFRRKADRHGEYDAVDAAELDPADDRVDQALAIERRQLQARLEAAILKLDGRCRELMRLKLEDYGFEEIRVFMGAASLNTVYTWDHRCRERLRELMGVVR